MGIVSQREIPDAIQVRSPSQRILTELHVHIAEEHAGATATPEELFLGRFCKGRNSFVPHFLLVVNEPYAELGPLSLHVVPKPFIRQLPKANQGTVKLFFLLVLKTADPKVVCVFFAKLVHLVQQGIEPLDFGGVFRRVVAQQAQSGLHPQRARLHRIQKVTELRNGFRIPLKSPQADRAFFPQDNADITRKRTRRERHERRVFGWRDHHFRVRDDQSRIENADGIEQGKAHAGLVLGTGHPGVRHLFGQCFLDAPDLAQTANSCKRRIFERGRACKQLCIQALGRLQLFELFQETRIAVLEHMSIRRFGILVQKDLEGIRMGTVAEGRIGHGGLDAQARRNPHPLFIFFKPLA